MQKAFSLVELSIVLVILGLLTGGILAGQSLIRAAELRSVVSEYQRYISASQSFRDKYFALPGDMPNAVRFWGPQAGGTVDGADSTCDALVTPSTGTATCNGNGDGDISTHPSPERTRFWQHMANAGLIEGSYNGVGGSPYILQGGVNVPKPRAASIWAVFHYRDYGINGFSNVATTPTLFIGGATIDTISNALPAFRPEEVWNIDTKLDDGRPAYGKVVMPNQNLASTAGCITTNAAATADYVLTNSDLACNLCFMFP
jgi:prepilin-type N-terminal cleavage/methylation domain-containing protein